jgi:hypothetical protein
VLASAASLARGGVSHLRYLIGALLAVELSLRWRTSLTTRGADAATVPDSYNRWLETERNGGTGVRGRRLRRWWSRRTPVGRSTCRSTLPTASTAAGITSASPLKLSLRPPDRVL